MFIDLLMTKISPDEDLSQSTYIQCWISYSYKEKTGPYVSVYTHSFNPISGIWK